MSDLRIVMGFDFTDPPSAHPNGEPGFLLPGSDGIWAVGFRLARDSEPRVLRGGAWNGKSEFMPGVGRVASAPKDRSVFLGIRLVYGWENT